MRQTRIDPFYADDFDFVWPFGAEEKDTLQPMDDEPNFEWPVIEDCSPVVDEEWFKTWEDNCENKIIFDVF